MNDFQVARTLRTIRVMSNPTTKPCTNARYSTQLCSYLISIGIVLGMALTAAFALAEIPSPYKSLVFKSHAEERRFQQLTQELRCLVCQNENLADSNANLAKDLRKEIYEMVQTGKTNTEIKNYLTARYSDFVLYDPPLKTGTFLLWFGPGLLLLIGTIVVIIAVRRRSPPGTAPALDEEGW